ncbi:MAG: Flp family type IVb pilin [Rhodospirillales bacterium]|nr:Flp family type IVb pilin [Rhodospirillales bacterium]MCB9979698.1 Flp family type IVb pilin [Rhodospirillales bacterium]
MFLKQIKQYATSDSGATAIEYGLIAGLLSILIITGLLVAGPEVESLFNSIGTELANANS